MLDIGAELQLLPEQFYDLTIGEILRCFRGYQMRETFQWERARFIAWFGSLPYQKKGTSIQLEDIMKLSTDPTDEEKEIIRQEQAAAEVEAVKTVLETYRQMGYNV